MKDKKPMLDPSRGRAGRGGDGLGPNTEIGARLRAFYGSVQEQPIPEHMLDLLEKLDSLERKGKDEFDRS